MGVSELSTSLAQCFDVIVLGAGAAGMMCAIAAGGRAKRVVLVEHAERAAKKVLISGGGRCNFTNIDCGPENFLSANPHFAKSALASYTPRDFIELVEKHHIPFHEKTLGQLFCDGSAMDIVQMLERECEAAGVRTLLHTRVTEVSRPDGFVVRTDAGELRGELRAPVLVIATGGLSIAKMGATGFGYEVARQFGLKVRECRPGLVPMTLAGGDKDALCDLAGVSAEVVASFGRKRFREKMLITHRGFSGPAILQISSYWDGRSPVTLDLAPGRDVTAPLVAATSGRDAAMARTALRTAFAARLADRLLEIDPPAGWTNHALAEYERHLHQWSITPAGTEGYEKAEVTAGGVDTDELSSRTMESRRVPGLYFIGEVVDVTGQLGGFNFQWAWASGAAAGRAV